MVFKKNYSSDTSLIPADWPPFGAEEHTIDFHILNFTALSVVGVLQYSLLSLAL